MAIPVDIKKELDRLETFIAAIREQCAAVERKSCNHREEERKAVRDVQAINQGVLDRLAKRIHELETTVIPLQNQMLEELREAKVAMGKVLDATTPQ